MSATLTPHASGVALAVQAHLAVARVIPGRPDVLAEAASAVVSPSAQRTLAADYAALPMFDPAALPAWEAFRTETLAQWHVLESIGWRLQVSDTDPYASAAELRADVARGRIVVLSSRATGGHPYLSDRENNTFRAVHDVIAHCATGRGFDRHGEEAAYQAHAALYSCAALPALVAETRGQNACLITDGEFPAQKIGLLPARWHSPDAMRPTIDELAAATADAIARHA